MQPWSTEFLTLAAAHFLALLSPGPDFFLLVGGTTRHGARYGLGAALGIATANAGYIACALAGFSLLGANPWVHAAMRGLSAGYLGWMGWSLLRSARRQTGTAFAAQREAPRSFGAGWIGGFLSGALNPKNGLFYLGLFSLVVSPQTSMGLRGLYGVWMFAVVLLWDGALVTLLRTPATVSTMQRHGQKIEGASGACLLGLALIIGLDGG